VSGALLPLAAATGVQHLPGVLRDLQSPLDQYGYLAVAGFVLVEDFGVPVPGETILILGAVYAGTGRLNVLLVGLVAFVAAGTSAAGGWSSASAATSCSRRSD
jgi:membrane protein DedA with SNARE-associated domain